MYNSIQFGSVEEILSIYTNCIRVSSLCKCVYGMYNSIQFSSAEDRSTTILKNIYVKKTLKNISTVVFRLFYKKNYKALIASNVKDCSMEICSIFPEQFPS